MGAANIPPPPRWLRPVLQAAWPVLGAVVTTLAVPVVVVGALHSLVDRRARLFRMTVLGVGLMWVDIRMLAGCLRLEAQLDREDGAVWRDAHERLFVESLDRIMWLARRWVGFEVVLADRMHFGAAATPLVAFARHAGPGDSFALAWLLSRTAGRLPRVVLAEALRWDPGVDRMLGALDAYFVPSGRGSGEDRAQGVAALARSLEPDDVLLLFPEGRNWSVNRQLDLIERLRERGAHLRAWRAARFRNVLPPRTGGVVACLSARPDADVMIVAHAGFGRLAGIRDIWDAVPFTGRPFLVKTWTYAASTLPHDPDGIAQWLDEHWAEVDTWVEEQYAATGPLGRLGEGAGGRPNARSGSGVVQSFEDLAGAWTVGADAGSPPAPVVAGSTVRLVFEDDAVSAETGCNRMRGGVAVAAGGVLDVAGPASTMMACEPPLMAQERWIGQMLSSGPRAAVDGDVLTLAWAEHTLRLTRD
ncbi:MAG TPA: META domain-containing protein [Dermatophilaceae bacterium]|nr:META domain-containing protein [Dermatophilaceae bacterium]